MNQSVGNTRHCCKSMKQHLEAQEIGLTYVPEFVEYGLEVRDGGDSFVVMRYCPWCGKKLPPSLRVEWFDELERLGIDPGDPDAVIPEEFKTDAWYRKRGE